MNYVFLDLMQQFSSDVGALSPFIFSLIIPEKHRGFNPDYPVQYVVTIIYSDWNRRVHVAHRKIWYDERRRTKETGQKEKPNAKNNKLTGVPSLTPTPDQVLWTSPPALWPWLRRQGQAICCWVPRQPLSTVKTGYNSQIVSFSFLNVHLFVSKHSPR